MTYGGVDVDMYWADGFWREGTDSYYSTGSPIANHDVVIVGWDDAFAASNFASAPAGPGAFIVRNSWGTGFGQAGYFHVSYYDTTLARGGYNMAFAAAVPADDYNRVYQYDPLGYWPEDGPYVSSSVGWFANEFTAQEADTLAAAGFYTPLPGCTYEIHSGASLAGLELRSAGTIATAGYHVVPLDTPAPLTAGQDFVIAVKLTMPSSYAYSIPVERPYPGYSTATADPGESFVITDAAGWRDLTTLAGFGEANVCLKAFTTGLPAGTFSVNNQAAYTRSTTATLTATVTGAAEMRYRDAGGVWSDWEVFASSRTWTLPPGDGPKTVEAEFRNGDGTIALSDAIALDTHRPTTRALYKASVRRYGYVRLYFKVADSAPCAAKATVTIRIKTLGGVTRKTIELGKRYVNRLQSYRFRCTLAKRTYRYYVYATDAAGNTQRSVGRNYLVVK